MYRLIVVDNMYNNNTYYHKEDNVLLLYMPIIHISIINNVIGYLNASLLMNHKLNAITVKTESYSLRVGLETDTSALYLTP